MIPSLYISLKEYTLSHRPITAVDLTAVAIYYVLGALLFMSLWLLLDYSLLSVKWDRALRIVLILLAILSIFATYVGFL